MPNSLEKLTKRIQQLLSEIILYELNDPRIKLVSITKVKLSRDFRYCTVSVSMLGSPSQQRTSMRGLEHSKGFIQKKLGARLSLRHVPILTFEQDYSIEKSFEIQEKLRTLTAQSSSPPEGTVSVDPTKEVPLQEVESEGSFDEESDENDDFEGKSEEDEEREEDGEDGGS